MIIYARFDQNQMNTLGGVVFFFYQFVNTNERRQTTTDKVRFVKLTWDFVFLCELFTMSNIELNILPVFEMEFGDKM